MLTSILLSLAWKADVAFALPSIIEDGIAGCDFQTGNIDASCVPLFIAHIIKVVFGLTGGICFILIILSGYRLILSTASGGDKSAGLEMLRWAIIGFVSSALTFFIIDFVISFIAGV